MSDSANLKLPFITAAQAQKHVTHNEALRSLDALVQLAVLDRDLATPPATPMEGERYIVAPGASGAWTGQAGKIASWQDGLWEFHAPNPGWLCWVADEGVLLAWSGAAWADALATISAFQNLSLLGIGTTADATNPFSAKLNKALWTAKTVAEGGDGDLRYTLNKEAASDVLSLLLQRGSSARAELGLIGDDDFVIKVSPDGTASFEALRIDKDTGAVSFPNSSIGGAAPAVVAASYASGATTSCASGVWTTINDWTALREDLGNASYSAATGQITITAATAGWWNLCAAFGPNGGAADVGTRIRKNASTILAFGRIQAGTTQTDTRVIFCAGAAYLAADDTIEVQGFHSKGSATPSTGITTVFSMIRAGLPA